jgi:hypothetical protein
MVHPYDIVKPVISVFTEGIIEIKPIPVAARSKA